MGLRQCNKCGEMVDEAKAFCPSCGHAFVEEQTRKEPTAFESMDGTMQFGQTMYNQMLTDMGLNISAGQNKPVETVKPAAPTAARPPVQQIIQPAVQQVIPPATKTEAAKPAASGKTKWVIIGGVAIVLLFILLVIIAVAAFVLWSRFA